MLEGVGEGLSSFDLFDSEFSHLNPFAVGQVVFVKVWIEISGAKFENIRNWHSKYPVRFISNKIFLPSDFWQLHNTSYLRYDSID